MLTYIKHLDYFEEFVMCIHIQTVFRPQKGKMTYTVPQGNIKNEKSLIKWQIQELDHIKQMANNSHLPDLEQAFSYVENCKSKECVETNSYIGKILTCVKNTTRQIGTVAKYNNIL